MAAPTGSTRPRCIIWLALAGVGLLLGLLAGCATSVPPPPDPTECFLADTEEQFYSEILQGNQRISLTLELVDGVRSPHVGKVGAESGHWIPAGKRRLQFRVVLPPVGWNDGGSREARGYFDVELRAGHHYALTGDYSQPSVRPFHVVDVTAGQPISAPLDFGFFAPVDRTKIFIPIIIPIK